MDWMFMYNWSQFSPVDRAKTQSPFSYRRAWGSIPNQSMQELWLTQWHCDSFLSPCQYHSTNALHVARTATTTWRMLGNIWKQRFFENQWAMNNKARFQMCHTLQLVTLQTISIRENKMSFYSQWFSRPALEPARRPVQWVSGVKRPGRDFEHRPASIAEVKEGVHLSLYFPSGPPWPIIGRNFPFCHCLKKTSLFRNVTKLCLWKCCAICLQATKQNCDILCRSVLCSLILKPNWDFVGTEDCGF